MVGDAVVHANFKVTARLTLKFVQVWLMLGSDSWTIVASTWCGVGIVWPNLMHGFCAKGGGGGGAWQSAAQLLREV